MKHLKQLYFTLICMCLVLVSCHSNPKNQIEDKPNIIFFLVDDQRNDILGVAGHPILKTPAIDHLAEKGTRFTNAFVTTSICAASRASILTSLYESKHEYTFGTEPLNARYSKISYPYLLKESGYQTGFIGKLGVKLENQDSILPQLFDYIRLSTSNVPHFETLQDGSKRHSSEIKGDQAIEFFEMRDSSKPFCLSLSFNAVHAVDWDLNPGNEGHYPYPEAAQQLYKEDTIPQPELSNPEIFENHPDFLKNSMNRERYFWRWDTDHKYQTNMKAYFRMISGYDMVIQRVLSYLESNNLDKNTIIIFASDNGYYMGNRGFAGKWTHYEESLRIPLIVYDPRITNDSSFKESDKLTLNLDIPATILDVAGISIPKEYQGRSLKKLMSNENDFLWRNSFFIEHRMNNPKIPKFIGIRTERFVYTNYYEQMPQYEYLHDLKNDSDQLVNYLNHPDYKEIYKNLKYACDSMEYLIKN